MGHHPVQVIAVTGGKGGVGKSNISVNMSIALAQLGRRVMLLDADLGLANVDVLLGIRANKTLADVLSGECSLRDVLISGPGGVRIVPASSGVQQMASLSKQQHGALIRAFSDISDQLDVLVIDTAAGISDTVVSFVRAANEALVVVCDEPSSVTDAYALIKLLHRDAGMQRFRVVANMTRSANEGQLLVKRLQQVCDKFLDVALQFEGSVPFDENVRKAVQHQKALVDYSPQSKASIAIRSLASRVSEWPLPKAASGNLEFFVERLLETSEAGV
ncbi:MinD/ParA family protein [Simiduia curdlanivorans]|uniref:MinD/ParA family protein n=1 Tax=Simiduia curdlanivorans TaxID=1492769 RepID=A0ABV8V9H9_9GAMM|nr:MinD/ParA family protein [Simiduia curdlanivorans]MDN3639875.1 MinD/ParA family protein [Simiduia curdlanivorans]